MSNQWSNLVRQRLDSLERKNHPTQVLELVLLLSLLVTMRPLAAADSSDAYAHLTLRGLQGVGVIVEELGPEAERDGLTQEQLRTYALSALCALLAALCGMRYAEVIPLNGHTERALLTCAAALEAHSTHPLARAILDKAASLGITSTPAVNFTILQGKGAEATIDGTRFWIGSAVLAPGSLLAKDKGLAAVVDADYIPDSVDITDFAVYAIPAPRVEVAVIEKAIDRELEAVVAKGTSRPASDAYAATHAVPDALGA